MIFGDAWTIFCFCCRCFQESLSTITTELEVALRERIRTREWLDDPTRQRALTKLKSIHELLAYPRMIFDNAFLDNYFSTVSTVACLIIMPIIMLSAA